MMCRKSDSNSASLAAGFLRQGKIVILPTDTVYGFSGIVDGAHNIIENACCGTNCEFPRYNTDALIRRIKGRSETKPFITLIAHPQDIKNYTDDEIPQSLLSYWPGPLTIIVHDKNGGGTTAYRCPGDEWLRDVIDQCGSPIYSTSVNRSGSPVLHSIKEIAAEFGSETSLIVDAGDTGDAALPSTIVSLSEGKITVVRQGAVKIENRL